MKIRVVHRVYKKAATVPQIAMIVPTTIINVSKRLHFPSILTLAITGPTMDIIKAENEPTKAIIELNSGIMIETEMDSVVTNTR